VREEGGEERREDEKREERGEERRRGRGRGECIQLKSNFKSDLLLVTVFAIS
jgi:hypothetical protein